MPKKFKKTIENFTCEHCGKEVKGNGFTNHCSFCLWAKHVDVNPGDRASDCGGMMEPIRIETKGRVSYVIHRCLKCGFEIPNRVRDKDDFEIVLKIAQKYADKVSGGK